MRGVNVVVLDIKEGEWERDAGREFNLPPSAELVVIR